ncbi:AAA family ATPase [Nonomuraea sp. CA-141351]|uniref:AAA family ATPase n=1 Tax=Nonomuraea sp. CA-141351 TaxID=3239996 RepID=UPI003D8E95DC
METSLIVIRGNSGSGKSTLARAVRETYGKRGLALVGQDVVRRDMLRELDVPDGVNIGLLKTICLYSLGHGHHVILEGILTASRYAVMLDDLRREHHGLAAFFYMDIPWEETLRRHESRPQRAAFTPEQMREWYVERDLLPGGHEQIIDQHVLLQESTQVVLQAARLTQAPLDAERL